MNKKTVAITLGVMCALLTAGIIVQVNTVKNNNISKTTNSTNNELRDEVLRWKEKYEKVYTQLQAKENDLENVRQEATKNDNSASELEQELKTTKAILGLTDLSGTGIKITVADNENTSISDENISSKLVHNTDLLEIVNELKNAGAEAISINGQRLISTSYINCSGTVITINGEKINSPFIVSAIGNQESLIAISRPGSYLEIMKNDGIKVKVEKSNTISIPKYNKVIKIKYMKTVV